MRTHTLALGMMTAILFSGQAALAALEKVGVVGLAGKELSALDAEGKTRALKVGDKIFLNDDITSKDAKAQLIFLDRSTLTVNAGTNVKIDTFVYNPETTNGKLVLTSMKGAMRFVGGHLSKKEPVTIKTPVATIGIRGGIVDTHVSASGATDSIFVYGKEMTMTNGAGKTVSTTAFNTGFNLTDAGSLPTALPLSVIQQHLGEFEPSGTPVDGAPSKEDVGNGTGVNSGDSNSNGGSSSGGASGDSSTPQSNNAATPGTESAGTAANTVTGNVAENSRNDAVKQEVVNVVTGATPPSTGSFINTANNATLETAINTARNTQGLPPLAGTTPVPPTAPVAAPPATPVVVPVATAPAASGSSSSGGATYAMHGRYFSLKDDNIVNGLFTDAGERTAGHLDLNYDSTALVYKGLATDESPASIDHVIIPESWFAVGSLPLTESMINDAHTLPDSTYAAGEEEFDSGYTYGTIGGSLKYFRLVDQYDNDGQAFGTWKKRVDQGVFGNTVSSSYTFAQAIAESQTKNVVIQPY